MATVLERIDERVPDITARARQISFGRTVLTLIAAVFFGVGWIAGHAWLSVCWCAVAVKAGWLEARNSARDGAG